MIGLFGSTDRILHNIYLPWPNGMTTEIDRIAIISSGIFVIEVKNYSGWIFGNQWNIPIGPWCYPKAILVKVRRIDSLIQLSRINSTLVVSIKTNHHEYTSVERELFSFCAKYNFDYSEKESIFPFENLRSDLQLELMRKIKAQMMKNVIGAFCGDTEDKFYHFNKKDKSEGIYLNHDVYSALVKYKTLFEKQNYYEWIKYLEKANLEEDSYKLANKLDISTERQNLNPYRNVLLEFNQTRCFYCGKQLNVGSDKKSPVDHFIPWSFSKDDRIWNFVLSCPHCNSSKSNILPDNLYFNVLKERNNRLSNMESQIVQEDFKTYSYSKLKEMQHSAIFNGFEHGWKV